jgi:transcriptional regulator with XRE-family HTH domain
MPRRRQVAVIPEAVALWRHERGLTQQGLASAAGCSEALIAHVERGTRNLSRDTLTKIAAALMVPASALANDGEAA